MSRSGMSYSSSKTSKGNPKPPKGRQVKSKHSKFGGKTGGAVKKHDSGYF